MDIKHKTLKQHVSAGGAGDVESTGGAGAIPENNIQTPVTSSPATAVQISTQVDKFKNLLDESAKQAFARPWHRLERGLRLNRLRLYVDEMAPRCSFNDDEKVRFFNFLQNALDRKLLNTNKIVNYIPEEQKIISIKGLEVKRNVDGSIRWGFTTKKTELNQTRKKNDSGNEPKNGLKNTIKR